MVVKMKNKIKSFSRDSNPTAKVLADKGTEHSVALAFREEFKSDYLFNHSQNRWLKWSGTHWKIDQVGQVAYYARLIASQSSGSKGERSAFVNGVERFCKNDPTFSRTGESFDSNNYLLNCPNGTYDLKTGIRTDHDPRNLITKITGASPKTGIGERFNRFLREVFQGDDSLIHFSQIALGSALSGGLENHNLLYLFGDGRNGKSTLLEAIKRVCGTYAKKIPSSVLMRKGNKSSHPTEIANLMGCRLAIASEVDSSETWNESLIKEATGDDELSARFMNQDFFTFRRTWKFIICGNHKPRLTSINPAITNRIKLIPFKADFSNNPDPDLGEKLAKEDAYILQWLIDGHLMWIQSGKKLPSNDRIDQELQDYLDDQSTVFNWMEQTLEPSTSNYEPAKGLYMRYKDWALERGEDPLPITPWGEEMAKKFKKKRARNSSVYGVIFKCV